MSRARRCRKANRRGGRASRTSRLGHTGGAMRIAVISALAVVSSFATAASVQSYPTKAVRVVVPFTPGSTTDIIARTVTERLAASFGQPVIVDNRSGAGGTIGAGIVAKAAP